MADRYGIYCPSFVHAGGTLNLQQVDDEDRNFSPRMKLIRPGGALGPAAYILSTANPTFRFTTCDLITVLDAMNPNLFLFCSGGHVSRLQRRIEGGAFDPGSTHVIQSTAKGFLHVTGLEVNIDSDMGASMSLEYIPLSTAGENPITTTPAQSLGAAPVPAFMSQYFMGGMWLGASQSLGLKTLRVIPGIAFGTNRSDGGVFPRSDSSSILGWTPIIEADYLNTAISVAIGSPFGNVLGAAIKGYFQRGTTAVDGRIAAASSAHTRIQVAAGSWNNDSLRVSGEGDGMARVTVFPTGSTYPLAVATNVALGA